MNESFMPSGAVNDSFMTLPGPRVKQKSNQM